MAEESRSSASYAMAAAAGSDASPCARWMFSGGMGTWESRDAEAIVK